MLLKVIGQRVLADVMMRCCGVCWCNCVVMDVVLHVDGLMCDHTCE